MGDWLLLKLCEDTMSPIFPASIVTLAGRCLCTMMLAVFLVVTAAASATLARPSHVELDYAVYEGVSNATTGYNIFKLSVPPVAVILRLQH